MLIICIFTSIYELNWAFEFPPTRYMFHLVFPWLHTVQNQALCMCIAFDASAPVCLFMHPFLML